LTLQLPVTAVAVAAVVVGAGAVPRPKVLAVPVVAVRLVERTVLPDRPRLIATAVALVVLAAMAVARAAVLVVPLEPLVQRATTRAVQAELAGTEPTGIPRLRTRQSPWAPVAAVVVAAVVER
jgi:hypothetical protein